MARAVTFLRGVADELVSLGVPVHFVPGWETRGSETFDPLGVICHDTGGSATSRDADDIRVLLEGSATAPAPISQLYLSRSTGVHIVAAGRCNHARVGRAGPLQGKGNTNLWGIEAAANPGRPWPVDQYRWYVLLVAVLCRRSGGWSPARNVAAHREHQPGEKVDPQGIDMGPFRAAIAQSIANPQEDAMSLADDVFGRPYGGDGAVPVHPSSWMALVLERRLGAALDRLEAAAAAERVRDDALRALLTAGGGDAGAAAVMRRLEEVAAAESAAVAAARAELAELREQLADRDRRLAEALADDGG